jgi:ABC-type branched-subunit amino acid transport system permease subunit
LRNVLEGAGIGIILGGVIGLLLLWLGTSVFPDMEIIYLLIVIGLVVGLTMLVFRRVMLKKSSATRKNGRH